MDPQDEPLRKIADSLANLERLYAETTRWNEELHKEHAQRQKKIDELNEKWEERQKTLDQQHASLDQLAQQHTSLKPGWISNPWLQPGQISSILQKLALAILATIVLILIRR